MRRANTIPDENKFRSMLHTRGLKVTETRLAVHRAMMTLEHADAEKVREYLCEHKDAAASLSSIYNVLQQMAQLGIYAWRTSADSRRYFDVCAHPHPHVYDRKNGVYKNLGDPDGEIRGAILSYLKKHRIRGYTIEDVDIQIVCHPRGSSR